jgi:hypothetical protein
VCTAGRGAQIVPVPGLINPDEIKIDDRQIYFVDGITIHIYSLKDFKFIKKFGKEGEGPQEFLKHPQIALTVDVSTDSITVNGMARLSYFTKDGDFEKAVKTPWQHGRFIPFGDFFVGWNTLRMEKDTYNTLNIVDANFENPKELSRRKSPPLGGTIRLLKDPSIFRVYQNRLFVANKKDFIIDVFNKNGKMLYSIVREYEKRKVSDTDKEGIMDYFRKDPRFRAVFERFKNRLRFPEYFPAIRDFYIDRGKLYVRTYKKSQGKTEFFLLSLEGKRLKTVFLPIVEKDGKESYPYIIKNGKVYQLVENSDEEWELHIHPAEQRPS